VKICPHKNLYVNKWTQISIIWWKNISTFWHICTIEYYSVIKRNKLLS
jgi:hypothetical protein